MDILESLLFDWNGFVSRHVFVHSYKMSGFDGTEYKEEFEETMDNNSRPEPQPSTDMVSIASDMCEAELTMPPIGSTGYPCYNGIGVHVSQEPSAAMPEPDNGKRKRTDEPSDPAADSDEHFALSCVAALRRLPIRKNAEMRMRILHMLYEAEYGEELVLR